MIVINQHTMKSSEVLLVVIGTIALVGIAWLGSLDDNQDNDQVVVEDQLEDGSTLVSIYSSTSSTTPNKTYRIVK